MLNIISKISVALVSTVFVLGPVTSVAQEYPNKQIRLIVPFGAGGGADIPTRHVAAELSKELGQSIVIDNKQGASGIIAMELAANSPPDGYTLVLGTISTHSFNPMLFKSLPYDPVRSFAPVSRIAAYANLLVVPVGLGVTNMQQLVDLAKRRPLTFSSPGAGTTMHVQAEVLQKTIGAEMLHVPYANMGQYITDLVAGRTDMTFGSLNQVMQYVEAGKVVPIAVSTSERSPMLPNVPTLGEVGFKAIELSPWLGIFAPAGTPPGVVDKLNKAIYAVVNSPKIKETFAIDGTMAVADKSASDFASFLRADSERWSKAIQEANIPKQ